MSDADDNADRAGRTDRASRYVAAPPEAIYRALTDATALAAWLPPDGMTGQVTRYDHWVGGTLSLTLTYVDTEGAQGKSTSDSDEVVSEVVELVPGSRVGWRSVFVSDDPALAGAMTMTWILRPDAGGTIVEVVATNVPPGIDPGDHAVGMASSLTNLARYLSG